MVNTNSRIGRSWPSGQIQKRRWEGAQTNRLNAAHWATAQGQSLNDDLATYLGILRSRCEHEGSANSMIDGMIFTHQNDIVGVDGPTLQVQSDSSEYNDWLENQWQTWFRSPLPNPRISGASWLRLCVRGLWQSGEYLAQKVSKSNVDTPCTMRVKPIHPSRLVSPSDQASNPRIVMGIELTEDGEPTRYHIQEPNPRVGFSMGMGKTVPLSPDDIIHEFILREEDQYRGCPLMAPTLQDAGDLRDFDGDVLDASRQAANTGVYWFTNHVEAPYVNVSEQLEMERGTQSTGPPGWEPKMMTPQQPATGYTDFRRERQSSLGRPAGMPLMTVRLDASNHNYSSARFDGQGYHRAVRWFQYSMSGTPKSTGMLSELVDDVDREATVYYTAKRLPVPVRPLRVVYEWTWPVPPHVDPAKEGLGERIARENGTLPFADACAARGTDEDAVIRKQERTNQKLEAAGMPALPPIGAYPSKPMDFSEVFGLEPEETTGGGTANTANEKRNAHV